MPHVQQLTVPSVQQDAAAAIAALRERTGARRIATVGFCLGGFESFLAGADMPELAAVVGFYGVLTGERFGVDGPLERAGDIRTPLLGLFGGEDQAIPVEQVEQFDAQPRPRPGSTTRSTSTRAPRTRSSTGASRSTPTRARTPGADARLPRAPHGLAGPDTGARSSPSPSRPRSADFSSSDPASLVVAVLLELALEDLAGRVARQLVEEHDLARHLVVREVVLDVVLDLVLAEASRPVCSTTNAFSRWPNFSSSTPIAAASWIDSCDPSSSSTSAGNTFSPPETIISSSRPSMYSRPVGVEVADVAG